jgi:hypothetical protein
MSLIKMSDRSALSKLVGTMYSESTTKSQDLPVEGEKSKARKKSSIVDADKSGPNGAGGFDKDFLKKNADPDNKFSQETINKDMNKVKKESKVAPRSSKSKFDRLFEEVMGDEYDDDLDALGIDDGSDEVSDDEYDDEYDDDSSEVTLTLSSDEASALQSLLQKVSDCCGGGDEMDDMDDLDGDIEFETDDDEEGGFGNKYDDEDEEMLGTPLVNQKDSGLTNASNNKVGGTVTGKGDGKTGQAKVTDKVGDDGEEGTPIVNQKDKGMMKTGKGSNKVKSKKTNKPGQDYFSA